MVSRYGGLSSCRASWSISLFRHPAILLTVALISACGFQLRGGRPLPDVLRSVFIEVNQEYRTLEPPIVGSLRAALRARGAEVERKERDARAKLVIEELIEQRQVISVGPDGKAIEYELTTTIQYTVKADGETVLPHQTLSLSRDYSFNADAVLAKEAEELKLREAIQAELAELMMLRLEASLMMPSAQAEPAMRGEQQLPTPR